MGFAKTYSAQTTLLRANIITIEADISKGLHAFSVVGLPDKAVEESRDRVSAAIKNSGFTSPKAQNQKIVVSLAPADVRKEGPFFDLAIALAYLAATQKISFDSEHKIFLGELSLDGSLHPIRGVLPLVIEAQQKGFKEIFLPFENAEEAAIIEGISVFPSRTLKEVIEHINEIEDEENVTIKRTIERYPHTVPKPESPVEMSDFVDIRGNQDAKRGLEIAAAGGHNVCMYGPPGTGKTMLAKAFCGLLPPLSFEGMLEVTTIYSVAGTLKK